MDRNFSLTFLFGLLLAFAFPATAAAIDFDDIDGLFVAERIFNDFPDSELQITDNYPLDVRIVESAFQDGGPFANRHDVLFSDDGGNNPRFFLNDEPFDFSVDVTLTAGSNSPRKEGGMRINSSSGGDGLFIINTDAHEIVAFGGPLPFYSFNAQHGLSYDNGDTINMRMVYEPGDFGAGTPGTIEYIVDVGEGPRSSGPLDFTNLELGILDDSTIGVYGQGAPNDPDNDFYDITYAFPTDSGRLQPGDANQDFSFDQLDIVQVSIAAKYLSGQTATWGEGDWDGAPGGSQGDPPEGNGLFDQVDIIAALTAGKYLTGPYAALEPDGVVGDEQTSLMYDSETGELALDAPASTDLTSVFITSAGNLFIGDKPAVLDGPFDSFGPDNLFKSTIGGSFGSLSFGHVLPAGLSLDQINSDLSVSGSLAGGGGLGAVDNATVPEPPSLVLMAIGTVALTRNRHRRRRRR